MDLPGPPLWAMTEAQRQEVLGKPAPAATPEVRRPKPAATSGWVIGARIVLILIPILLALTGVLNPLLVFFLGFVIVSFCMSNLGD